MIPFRRPRAHWCALLVFASLHAAQAQNLQVPSGLPLLPENYSGEAPANTPQQEAALRQWTKTYVGSSCSEVVWGQRLNGSGSALALQWAKRNMELIEAMTGQRPQLRRDGSLLIVSVQSYANLLIMNPGQLVSVTCVGDQPLRFRPSARVYGR